MKGYKKSSWRTNSAIRDKLFRFEKNKGYHFPVGLFNRVGSSFFNFLGSGSSFLNDERQQLDKFAERSQSMMADIRILLLVKILILLVEIFCSYKVSATMSNTWSPNKSSAAEGSSWSILSWRSLPRLRNSRAVLRLLWEIFYPILASPFWIWNTKRLRLWCHHTANQLVMFTLKDHYTLLAICEVCYDTSLASDSYNLYTHRRKFKWSCLIYHLRDFH